MKKLSKIKLHDAVVLENREMKMIFGGSGSSESGRDYHWCVVDGESIGPLTSCTNEYCRKLYGSGAYCD